MLLVKRLAFFILFSILILNSSTVDSGDDEDMDVATIEDIPLSVASSGKSFSRSKRILALSIYRGHQRAFYSNCKYRIVNKKLVPVLSSCKYRYRKNLKRAKRIEWEHIMPAWHFGHKLKCWQRGGRQECSRRDKKFKEMEADMHNLAPAIGEINGDRSNYRYSIIEGEKRPYGRYIDMEIEFKDKMAEPPDNLFGDVARAYLYMRDRYGIEISPAQEKRFIKWNNIDPVDKWELERNNRIKEAQGNDNPYITNYRELDESQISKPIRDEDNREDNNPSEGSSGNLDSKDSGDSFSSVKSELEEKLAPLLNAIPQPFSTIILIVLTLIVLYFRKKSK